MRTIGGTMALVLALLVGGCGADKPTAAERREAAASASAEASASASARAAARRQVAQRAAWTGCKDATRDLRQRLQQINSRLAIGLSYSAFSGRLGDARVAYDGIDFKHLGIRCTLGVGIALEDGLNEYVKSYKIWQKCIEDYYCSVEGAVLAKMRKHWSEVGERLDHVDGVLGSPAAFARVKTF